MQDTEEIWKTIEDYPKYQVSNKGRVKSIARKENRFKELILKPSLSVCYHFVALHKDGVQKSFKIHTLVAQAFLGHKRCGYKSVINHKDFNPLNNNDWNLEITTQRKNSNKKHIPHSSKYTGVFWKKRQNKWAAQISVGDKDISLGVFTSEHEAHLMYEKKLMEING